jgi:hypothetical protein
MGIRNGLSGEPHRCSTHLSIICRLIGNDKPLLGRKTIRAVKNASQTCDFLAAPDDVNCGPAERAAHADNLGGRMLICMIQCLLLGGSWTERRRVPDSNFGLQA